MIAREVDVTARKLQEGIASDNGNDKNIPSSKASSSSANSTTTSWTRLKDPRIVRVSRAFGGKDRHSKVCTVRGLRDRRVRLSVPTAIQLYDLQDRLGLNQPSKVVDWLLNAAKHEIDELPPLQMPPTGNFNPNLHPILANYHGLLGASNNSQSSKEGLNLNSNNNSSSSINWDLPLEQSRSSNSLNCDVILRSKSKDVITETTNDHHKDQNNCSLENHGHYHNNILHRSPNDSYLPVPYGSFLKWDPSSLSLAQSGSSTHHGTAIQQPENIIHNFNGLALPSTVSVQLGSQVLVHPQGFPQSFFHPHNISGASDGGHQFDPKEINFQMLSSGSENPMSHSDSFRPSIDSTSQSVRPFHFLRSQNSTEGREPNKDMEFHSN